MEICSINVESSTGAFELLTRIDTGQRCNRSSVRRRLKEFETGPTVKPRLKVPFGYDDRHAVVHSGDERVGFGDNHHSGFQRLTARADHIHISTSDR